MRPKITFMVVTWEVYVLTSNDPNDLADLTQKSQYVLLQVNRKLKKSRTDASTVENLDISAETVEKPLSVMNVVVKDI